jgi:hypothetical protein
MRMEFMKIVPIAGLLSKNSPWDKQLREYHGHKSHDQDREDKKYFFHKSLLMLP